MSTVLQETIFHLTGKKNLQDVNVDDLTELVKDYPYFAPLQLVYTAKLKFDGSHKFNTQVQKTGLYFNNFRWLQYQMMDLSKISFATPKEEIKTVGFSDNLHPNIHIPTMEAVKEMMDNVEEKPKEFKDLITEEIQNSTILENINEEKVVTTSDSENTLLALNESIQNLNIPLKETTIVIPSNDFAAVVSPTLERQIEEIPNNSSDNEISNAVLEHQEKNIHEQIERLKQDWHVEPLPNAPLPFETEPYYTIDYFAAQGIKFDLNKEPHDELTKKMLRFTDWLKRMKSINEVTLNISDEDTTDMDNAIMGIAQVSNQSKEVVTETMAQVFEKQGKINKAIQLYIKLSFLNPDKTAYFATKIQELKGITS